MVVVDEKEPGADEALEALIVARKELRAWARHLHQSGRADVASQIEQMAQELDSPVATVTELWGEDLGYAGNDGT